MPCNRRWCNNSVYLSLITFIYLFCKKKSWKNVPTHFVLWRKARKKTLKFYPVIHFTPLEGIHIHMSFSGCNTFAIKSPHPLLLWCVCTLTQFVVVQPLKNYSFMFHSDICRHIFVKISKVQFRKTLMGGWGQGIRFIF